MSFTVRGLFWKFFVATLLAVCVVVYALDLSGRWDRTIKDANDEAGIVTVVLCVGAAVAAFGTLVTRVQLLRVARIIRFVVTALVPAAETSIFRLRSTTGPPLALRI